MLQCSHDQGHDNETCGCVYTFSFSRFVFLSTKAYYANPKFFKSRLVTKQPKLKLYRTVIRPIVTYASETWVLKETITQKLLVFERKFLKKNIWAYKREPNMESPNQ